MNPTGQWNHYRIESKDGTATLAVNGKVVTRGYDLNPRKGFNCLETEGSEIHFRNIRIDELPGSDPLADMVADFPQYVSTAEIRIEVTEAQKWDIVEQAVAHFKTTHDVIDVDGARVLFGDGWALLRTSNTQPVIVARFEARTQERLDEIREEVAAWLSQHGVSLP